MKKCMLITAFLCCSALLCTGCESISNTTTDLNLVADTTTALEETTTAPSATTQADATTTEAVAEESDSTETSALEEDTTAEETTTAINETDSDTEDVLVEDTGMTSDAWLEKAQAIYDNAASVYFDYFASSSGFEYDLEQTDSEGYVPILNCDSLDSALSNFYNVFSESYFPESLFDDQFKTVDGTVYRLCGDRGADISYIESQVTSVTECTDTSITFNVDDTYAESYDQEAGTISRSFSLVYENGNWLVSEFTMPY